ncbi:MAG: hypothetical protein VXY42_02695 [Candidatus Thermoplasmatota archaeon]|nr:hypothetical protein [Candidatus Thermoplasmatota archaeon]MEC8609395.1 hypothetical protein [Candidatus Thermoplasmatota archaeon]
MKNDLHEKIATIVGNEAMIVLSNVEITEIGAIPKRKIGYVHPVKMSTFHGERSATVAVKPRKVMSKPTNHHSKKTAAQTIVVNDLDRKIMVEMTGSALLVTISTSHSEQNATNVENRNQEAGVVNVHEVDVIPTAVVDSVTAEIPIVEVKTVMLVETSEDLEVAEMSGVILNEDVQTVMVAVNDRMNAIGKLVGRDQVMHIIEARNPFDRVDINEGIKTIEVRTRVGRITLSRRP